MPDLSKYQKTYTSFSGVDIVASITPPGSKAIIIGEIQTLSYSIHREKAPVRPLGHINPKGFTYGGRTIAGTMIFTVFDRHIIKTIFEEMFLRKDDYGDYEQYDRLKDMWRKTMYERMVVDELPPFDVNITMTNEYGQSSFLNLLGVTLVDEGQVMSIEDLIVENTTSFLAQDIRLMRAGETTLDNWDYVTTPIDYESEEG